MKLTKFFANFVRTVPNPNRKAFGLKLQVFELVWRPKYIVRASDNYRQSTQVAKISTKQNTNLIETTLYFDPFHVNKH